MSISMDISRRQNLLEVGVDEAGRGSLIGRVYAGVVMWNNRDLTDFFDELKEIRCHSYKTWDSKKIPHKRRILLKEFIEENAIDYAIGYAEPEEVDSQNILQATFIAMHRALDNLTHEFNNILVDGTQFKPYFDSKKDEWSPYTCIPHGDANFISIGAASVLAKVAHDQHITELCEKNPFLNEKYDLLNNMGYGTKKHLEGIRLHGVSEYHRKSYKCCK